MGIAAFVVFVFGIYLFFKRRGGEPVPSEAQELGGRIGRSVQGAIPLPGLTGQPGAHLMPERGPDEIGPEDEHIVIVKRPGDRADEIAGDASLEDVRSRIDAILAKPPAWSRPRRG